MKRRDKEVIRITRSSAPPVLSTSKARKRYGLPEVVKALLLMQHSKCCYCEEYIPDSGPGKQVEHFRPQCLHQDLVNDWGNLLLACETCNFSKCDKFPTSGTGEPLLLDPSNPSVDPEEHIEFIVGSEQNSIEGNGITIGVPIGLAVARDQSAIGNMSIKTIGLTKEHHIKRRERVVRQLESDYVSLLTEIKKIRLGTGAIMQLECLKQRIRGAMGDDQEFAGVARSFCRKRQLEKHGVSR